MPSCSSCLCTNIHCVRPPWRERLKTYAFITAANTGSTLLWNQSVKVGGRAFFPIFLTMCSGQIVLISPRLLSVVFHSRSHDSSATAPSFFPDASRAPAVLALS